MAPYRFNNHVADPNGTNNGMSLKEIEDGVFLTRKPSKHMQNVLGTCNAKENIVMGHCQVKKEMEDKQPWLDKYYPMIKERLLVYEDKSKADTILQYCKTHNIDLNDVVYVDDVISFLREAERKGIKSYHISSFWIGIISLYLVVMIMHLVYTMDKLVLRSYSNLPIFL